ncbi:MAG: hypothetical protein A2V88_06640 [Elusimicrobia bacterium RBG_16_66_12]|nr:MAG: hypothetical protein A2V88_06640 [Elusimicrobia bacterium RBG_16_66_12]
MTEPTGRRRLATALPPLAVVAATAAVFLPTLRNGFVNFDDGLGLLTNPHYRGLGWTQLRWMLTTIFFCNYSPLTWMTFGLDFILWGMAPSGYHLTSVAFHCAGAAMLSLLALELFARGRPAAEDRWGAAAAALAFSLHPMRAESVAWAFERRDVVCGLFFIAALYLWLRGRRPGETRAARWRILALGSFLLALSAKVAAAPLPLVLVIMDVALLKRPSRDVWRDKLPFFALSALFVAVGLLAQSRCGAVVPLATAAAGERLLQSVLGLFFYPGKTLWPSRLSPLYEWGLATVGLPALIGALALSAAAFTRRMRPAFLAAFAAYAVIIAPTLGLLKLGHHTVADRYSYLSCLPWAVLAGAGVRALWSRHAAAASAACLVILLAMSAMTRRQIAVWRDSVTLWRHVLKLDALSAVGRQNLADGLLRVGRVGEAVLLLDEQVRLYPRDSDSRRMLSEVLEQTGITPADYPRFHDELGREWAARGEPEKAAWHFKRGAGSAR